MRTVVPENIVTFSRPVEQTSVYQLFLLTLTSDVCYKPPKEATAIQLRKTYFVLCIYKTTQEMQHAFEAGDKGEPLHRFVKYWKAPSLLSLHWNSVESLSLVTFNAIHSSDWVFVYQKLKFTLKLEKCFQNYFYYLIRHTLSRIRGVKATSGLTWALHKKDVAQEQEK